MKAIRCHSVPVVCQMSVVPSPATKYCAEKVIKEQTGLKMKNLITNEGDGVCEKTEEKSTTRYEAVKIAAGGRRFSDNFSEVRKTVKEGRRSSLEDADGDQGRGAANLCVEDHGHTHSSLISRYDEIFS